jgi:hypothetical protein
MSKQKLNFEAEFLNFFRILYLRLDRLIFDNLNLDFKIKETKIKCKL